MSNYNNNSNTISYIDIINVKKDILQVVNRYEEVRDKYNIKSINHYIINMYNGLYHVNSNEFNDSFLIKHMNMIIEYKDSLSEYLDILESDKSDDFIKFLENEFYNNGENMGELDSILALEKYKKSVELEKNNGNGDDISKSMQLTNEDINSLL